MQHCDPTRKVEGEPTTPEQFGKQMWPHVGDPTAPTQTDTRAQYTTQHAQRHMHKGATCTTRWRMEYADPRTHLGPTLTVSTPFQTPPRHTLWASDGQPQASVGATGPAKMPNHSSEQSLNLGCHVHGCQVVQTTKERLATLMQQPLQPHP